MASSSPGSSAAGVVLRSCPSWFRHSCQFAPWVQWTGRRERDLSSVGQRQPLVGKGGHPLVEAERPEFLEGTWRVRGSNF